MTIPVSARQLPFFVLAIALVTASCGSARFYRGFDYRGSAQAPDLSGEVSPTLDNHMITTGQGTITTSIPEATGTVDPSPLVDFVPDNPVAMEPSPLLPDSLTTLTTRLYDEARILSESGKSMNTREIARNLASSLEASGQAGPLSARQEKKLLKTVSRMERKMKKQGGEIDWKNNTGLELFFLIMAIAGLVLGILTVGFGWFVFIVFAGLWLYWKLVKDKP